MQNHVKDDSIRQDGDSTISELKQQAATNARKLTSLLLNRASIAGKRAEQVAEGIDSVILPLLRVLKRTSRKSRAEYEAWATKKGPDAALEAPVRRADFDAFRYAHALLRNLLKTLGYRAEGRKDSTLRDYISTLIANAPDSSSQTWSFVTAQRVMQSNTGELLCHIEDIAATAGPVNRNKRGPYRKKGTCDLTARQVEVMQIVGEHKGNISEAARCMGLDRKTVSEHFNAACKKLGKKAMSKPRTRSLPQDNRGQANVSRDRRLS